MKKERRNEGIVLIPQRLREARISCSKTIKEIADKIGVSAQVLSMYELGRCKPSAEVFYKLKNEYPLPIKYYTKPYIETVNRGQIYFRSFSTATKNQREIAYIRADWITQILMPFISERIKFPPVDHLFCKVKESMATDCQDKHKLEILAKIVRREWGLGLGPINNLTRELEKRGVVIVKLDLDDAIDGFSFWEQNRPYIFVNQNNNPYRLRMSLAHELCHLLCHEAEDVEKNLKRVENEAKRFASAFLMPEPSFSNDIFSTSLEQLLMLKPQWMVSVQAMVMRCEQLNLIDEDRAIYLQKQISRKRWRKIEPGDLDTPSERPVLLRQAVQLLIEKRVISKNDLLDKISLEGDFLEEACSLPKGFFSLEDNIVQLSLA